MDIAMNGRIKQTELPMKVNYNKPYIKEDLNETAKEAVKDTRKQSNTSEGLVPVSGVLEYDEELDIISDLAQAIVDEVYQNPVKEAVLMYKKVLSGFLIFGSIGLVAFTTFVLLGLTGNISFLTSLVGSVFTGSLFVGVILDFKRWERRYA